jgi:Phosphotransferase System HPr (HPr) Family
MGLLNRRSAPATTEKVEKEITIVNRLGLHARPAAMFVRIASRHRCEIWVAKEDEEINGKSIMGLMMLAAGQGSRLRVRARAPTRPGAPGYRRINPVALQRRVVDVPAILAPE